MTELSRTKGISWGQVRLVEILHNARHKWSGWDILQNISELQCTHVQCTVHLYSGHTSEDRRVVPLPGVRTGEDMVQTSESRPIRGQGWRQWANHSLGWREVGGPWCWGQCAVFTGQATPVPSSKPSRTLLSSLRDRQGVQTSDSCLKTQWQVSKVKWRKLVQDDDITVLEPVPSLPRPRCRQGKLQMSISCRFVCRDVLWRVIQTIEHSV